MFADIDHELKCLRQWFKVMESRLEPLDFRAKYTKTEIETKALELNVSTNLFSLIVYLENLCDILQLMTRNVGHY